MGESKQFSNAEQARKGLEKQKKGEQPNSRELHAIERERRRVAAEVGRQWIRSVAKTDYATIADRQIKQINEQAERYGMPCGGPTVDLQQLVRWMYELLARHGSKLRGGDGATDPLLVGAGDSPALERYRLAKAIAAERENLIAERNLVPAVLVQQGHARIGARMKWAGEQLAKRFGDQAADILRQAIEASRADVEALLSGRTESQDAAPDKPEPKKRKR